MPVIGCNKKPRTEALFPKSFTDKAFLTDITGTNPILHKNGTLELRANSELVDL
jgi:hypothetical protein